MQQQPINKAQTSRFYLDVPSPLGTLRLESDGEALTALHFEDTKAVHTTTVAWHEAPQLPLFKEVQTWLERYFGGQDPGKRPPLRPQGTAFQQAVWQQLLAIPHAQTTTYGALAAHLAKQKGQS